MEDFSAEAVKLFVGQVPRHMTEEELLPMFKEAGPVQEIIIIKDKTTKASRGKLFKTNLLGQLFLFRLSVSVCVNFQEQPS